VEYHNRYGRHRRYRSLVDFTDLGPPSVPGVSRLELIGRGGHSAVYKGYQTVVERWVAVKVLAAPVTDTVARVTFEEECRALGRLTRVPTVYDANVLADGRPYIVMELCTGSVVDLVRRKGRLTPEQAGRIAYDVARALQEAHARMLIHRDVKPGNILIRPTNEAVLGDFGLSLRRGAAGEPLAGGSPEFAAPEQLTRDVANERTDLYGLGASMYYMLTGAARRAGAPLPADVPRPMAEFVDRLMDPDADRRPADAGEALIALGAIAASPHPSHQGGFGADSPTLPGTEIRAPFRDAPRGASRRRPRWVVPAAVAGAVFALGAAAWGVTAFPGDRSAAPPAPAHATRTAAPVVSAPTSAVPVNLAEPVDHGTTVDLSWSGASGYSYAVSIAEAGKPARRQLVGPVTAYQVPVEPSAQYCFQVVATSGRTATVSPAKGIRGAVCRF
jgi:eukaryotic-like serine/threonine-protein kinase